MPVQVQVTYDMSKVLGVERFEVEAATVGDAVEAARQRFGSDGESFDRLTGRAALAVNGVLMRYRKGRKTPLCDGDVVTFVKAAAGG